MHGKLPRMHGYTLTARIRRAWRRGVVHRSGRFLAVWLLTGVAFAGSCASAYGSPGSLDPSFGTRGVAVTSIGDGNALATAVAPTSDGGEVAAGSAIDGGQLEVAILRYTSSGQADASFGMTGVVTRNFGHTTSQAEAVAALSDGDVLIAGSADNAGGDTDVLLALYSSTGTLVPGFGNGGYELEAVGNGNDAQANAIAVSGANVYVAGRAANNGHTDEFFESFAALNGASNGAATLASFGDGTDTEANAIALAGSNVVLAGFTEAASGHKDVLVTDMTISGGVATLNPAFDTTGASALSLGSGDAVGDGLVDESGGRIVVSGSVVNGGATDVLLVGLTAAGAIDETFGSSGITVLAIGSGGDAFGNAISLSPAGELVVAGKAADTLGGQPANLPLVARLSATGSLDTSFAPSSPHPGTELLACAADSGFSSAFAQSNGEIVVAGNSGVDGSHQAFLLARLLDTQPGAGTGCGSTGGGGTTTTPTTTTPPPINTGCSTTTMTFGVLAVRACFTREGTRYLATGSIDLDGLSIVPSPCTSLVFDAAAETITTECNQGGAGEVAISVPIGSGGVNGIPLYRGTLDWTIPTSSGDTLGAIDAGSFAELEGFPIVGQINPVAMSGGVLDVPVSTSLPSPFDLVHGSASLQVSLNQPLSLGALTIGVSEVWIGPLDINNLDIAYNAAADTWTGSAQATFAAPLDYGVGATAEFHNGSFAGFGASVDFGTPGVAIASTGLFLNNISFGVFTAPLTITGGLGFDYAGTLDVDGNLVVKIRHGGWAIRVSGGLSIASVPLASVYLEVDSNGDAFFVGGLDYGSCDAFCVTANATGWVDFGNGTFDASASASTEVLGLPLSGGQVEVSSKSIGVCGEYTWPVPPVTFALGGVYVWDGGFSILGGVTIKAPITGTVLYSAGSGGDCDLSPYQPTAPTPVIGPGPVGSMFSKRGALLATVTADQLTVKAHTHGLVWSLHGTGSPPQVAISGPNGENLESNADGAPAKTNDSLILEDPTSDTTFVLLDEPAAGDWVITPDGGSAIASIDTSTILPPARVSASVSGHGISHVLHYRFTPEPGQTVRFLEKKGTFEHPIATVTKASGSVAFTSADGPGGRRMIVADVLEGITTRKALTVASYVAPAHVGPNKPSHLIIRRTGSTLRVSWRAGGGASLYLVTVRATDGSDRQTLVHGSSVQVKAFPSFAGASVSVAGRTTFGEQGPAVNAKLAAPTVPKLKRAPRISGRAAVGKTLSCSSGTWSGHPARYVTQWLRDGMTIAGATRRTLRLSSAQSGAKVVCLVTARNRVGFATGSSKTVSVSTSAKKHH
jgi:uncharacterized delta-60 repeat protein